MTSSLKHDPLEVVYAPLESAVRGHVWPQGVLKGTGPIICLGTLSYPHSDYFYKAF